jgi:hypothetical protein
MTELLQAHTLLMVPSKDLRGMLDEGPCGFRPPMSWAVIVSAGAKEALVLRWEGQDLPHGWLAAAWATGVAVTLHSKGPSAGQAFLPGMHLRALREAGCTLIALNEQGREVNNG